MKDGFIIDAEIGNKISEEDLKVINKFTKRNFKADEIYVFSVVLCDNEIDREFEKFTPEALKKLSELFVGTTGILNHDMKSENQRARIFSCSVNKVPNLKNSIGEPYFRLVAKAYMPRIEKNKDFILSIESGITKEVSVGCKLENIICSICGKDVHKVGCNHIKGQYYKQSDTMNLCHFILDNPSDAYEWSFVAVPMQKNAGVIKGYVPQRQMIGGDSHMKDVIKQLSFGKSVNLSQGQCSELYDIIKNLEEKAKIGDLYKEDLKKEVLKFSVLIDSKMSDIMKSVMDRFSIDELRSLRDIYKSKYSESLPVGPQISKFKGEDAANLDYTQFKI